MSSHSINILCVKIGTKYASNDVNALYRMCKRHVTTPFNFFCYTDNSNGLDKGIHPIEYIDFDLEPVVYNKLRLFDASMPYEGHCVYFDVDIVLRNNIDNIITLPSAGKLKTIQTYWRPANLPKHHLSVDASFEEMYYVRKQPHNLNSSVMIWDTNSQLPIWNDLLRDKEAILTEFFIGMDSFLYYRYDALIDVFEKNEIGSYLYGTDFDYENDVVIRNTGDVPVLLLNGMDIDRIRRVRNHFV